MAILGLGSALPSRAFPPDPCSEAPRSQVVAPGGWISRTSRACGYEPRPRDAISCSAFRIVSGDAPHEQGCESSSIASYRGQLLSSSRSHLPRQFESPGKLHTKIISRDACTGGQLEQPHSMVCIIREWRLRPSGYEGRPISQIPLFVQQTEPVHGRV